MLLLILKVKLSFKDVEIFSYHFLYVCVDACTYLIFVQYSDD